MSDVLNYKRNHYKKGAKTPRLYPMLKTSSTCIVLVIKMNTLVILLWKNKLEYIPCSCSENLDPRSFVKAVLLLLLPCTKLFHTLLLSEIQHNINPFKAGTRFKYIHINKKGQFSHSGCTYLTLYNWKWFNMFASYIEL